MRLSYPACSAPALHELTKAARRFYNAQAAPALFAHASAVLDRAVRTGIVEPEAMVRGDDPARAWANTYLAQLILLHPLDMGKVNAFSFRSGQEPPWIFEPGPEGLMFRTELALFGELTALNRRGAPASEYQSLLEQPSLALLALLADYAVSHESAMCPRILLSDHPLFRTFASEAEARVSITNDARIGTTLAALAELFGWPDLAGDILVEACKVRYPELHDYVSSLYLHSDQNPELAATQRAVEQMMEKVAVKLDGLARNSLRDADGQGQWDFEIIPRPLKHSGKFMRKIIRKAHDAWSKEVKMQGEATIGSFDQYLQRVFSTYNFRSFNDPIAWRLVLATYEGQSVDTHPQSEDLIAGVVGMVSQAIRSSIRQIQIIAIKFYRKSNGYSAVHLDAEETEEILPTEGQIITLEKDRWARCGGAAHSLYLLESDPTRQDIVFATKAAYHRAIFETNGNGYQGFGKF